MTPPETRPRRAREDGARSRRAILHAAARLATIEGLEGVSIGRLAEEIGMSKSGLYAHFDSKEDLQLATVDTARVVFIKEVIGPASTAAPGAPHLLRLAECFLSYVERGVFPGGCFFSVVAAEFSARNGKVKQRVAAYQREWMGVLEAAAVQARKAGHIPSSVDPAQLAFEVNALLVAANTSFLLHGDAAVMQRAKSAVAARLVPAG